MKVITSNQDEEVSIKHVSFALYNYYPLSSHPSFQDTGYYIDPTKLNVAKFIKLLKLNSYLNLSIGLFYI